MNSSNKFFNFLLNLGYWQEYNEYSKLKSVLTEFFTTEDDKLQQAFIKNFDYPEDMVDAPVRFEPKTGDVYYTLNFKSKELFENSGTQEKALSNSLVVLDKFLPLGVTQYLEPQPPIHIPDTFTLLCSLRVLTDTTPKKTLWNTVGSIFKPLTILSILGIIIAVCVKYLMQ